ncbi:related to Golgi apparatus membrane protein TVP18 [Saccharomycodes ludwigii]|uniref:Golgi apparatus membrane protein TVP18 n=1 Tax=Saccharomycodes ludwigii TaxID=36035 RepID=A0A376BAE2_9ASCO|nr:hypothetical protein SCDLUD_005274 [Saccharomycodes ludwigii]KAH3898927.1 hypothetical protein SCDLUD_005274 [Saccharomycodes ludwigii]SSD61090.1 related to Golgi apparatus membrane protein TVP18 [Saccharomycodes ludwigii]
MSLAFIPALKQLVNVGQIVSNLKSFNFSLYGRYMGYINILLCFAFGIANLFHVSPVIAFGIVSIIQGLILIFVEIPFLLKICPLSDNFINIIRKFETNGYRVFFYTVMAAIQWCSLAVKTTSLIVVALGLSFSAISYFVAILKKQDFQEASSQQEAVIKHPVDLATDVAATNIGGNVASNGNANKNNDDLYFDLESGREIDQHNIIPDREIL